MSRAVNRYLKSNGLKWEGKNPNKKFTQMILTGEVETFMKEMEAPSFVQREAARKKWMDIFFSYERGCFRVVDRGRFVESYSISTETFMLSDKVFDSVRFEFRMFLKEFLPFYLASEIDIEDLLTRESEDEMFENLLPGYRLKFVFDPEMVEEELQTKIEHHLKSLLTQISNSINLERFRNEVLDLYLKEALSALKKQQVGY